MDISTKVLSLGVVGAIIGGLALWAFQSLLILPYLDHLEFQAAREKASQVESLFVSEAENLSLTTEDWAYWDDSAHFLEGVNPDFEDENLFPAAFESIRLDAMLFFRTDGGPFWARQISEDRRTLVDVPNLSLYQTALEKLGPKQAAEGTQGYLQTSSGLVLVALRQVRPAKDPGKPQGTLIMVRHLESNFWPSFQKRTGMAVVPGLAEPDLSLATGPSVTRSPDRTTTSLRIPLADLHGDISLVLSATLPRTLTVTGLGLLIQVAWGSIIILLLTTVANGFLIRTFLVRPVKDLWRLTQEVEVTGNFTLRAPIRSRDEIGELSRGVNGLIQSVEETTGRLKELASTDPLTGLANRRTFDQSLDLAWRAALRDSEPLSMIMGDVDRFKEFNDHHGHQGGDACLKVVAQMIRDVAARPTDVKARYGGEEFAIILPQTDLAGARIVAERLRSAVEDLRIVTISLGCASMVPNSDNTPAQLLETADRNLYQAKADGRNRVRS